MPVRFFQCVFRWHKSTFVVLIFKIMLKLTYFKQIIKIFKCHNFRRRMKWNTDLSSSSRQIFGFLFYNTLYNFSLFHFARFTLKGSWHKLHSYLVVFKTQFCFSDLFTWRCQAAECCHLPACIVGQNTGIYWKRESPW